MHSHPVGERRAGDDGLAEGADVDAQVCCEAVVEVVAGAQLQEALDALDAQLRQAPASRPCRLRRSQQPLLSASFVACLQCYRTSLIPWYGLYRMSIQSMHQL